MGYGTPPIDLSILSAAFKNIWGYETGAFDPQLQEVYGYSDRTRRTESGKLAGSPYYRTLPNGRELYMPMEVVVGTGTIPGTSTTYAEALGVRDDAGNYTGRWQLPVPIITGVEGGPHVIDTELTERTGMVSQLISMHPWRVLLKVILINFKENGFPEDDYATMIRLVKLAVPFEVNNPLTDYLFMDSNTQGESLVTIRNFRMIEGRSKMSQGCELELVQEVPFNLVDIS